MAPRTIKIQGKKIAAQRRERGLSIEGLSREVPLSVSTIRRAEQGLATEENVRIIANYFKIVLADLLINYDGYQKSDSSIMQLEGDWVCFYNEEEPGFDPYFAKEKLRIEQVEDTITGEYIPVYSAHPQGYLGTDPFNMTGICCKDFVMGTYGRSPRSALYPRGSGTFHLKSLREGNWLDGYCTFYTDEGIVAVSSNIWIRAGLPFSDRLCEQAEAIMRKKPFLHLSSMSIY